MEEMIFISSKEYHAIKEKLSLLKETALIKKINRLVELLYKEKYDLYLGNNTDDLTEAAIDKNWQSQNA